MDVRKLREGDTGREGSTEDVWDISSFDSPSRTAARQMNHTSMTGKSYNRKLYCCPNHNIAAIFFSFFFFNVCSSVCVSAVCCSTTAGLAEAPERVKQQRDQTITKTLIKKKKREEKKKPKQNLEQDSE